ncbi:rhomboid family intramembrane serine protease [Archangium sp.]|uniref:rhomboid family intramembrane serine protease n=1 Tax=Archangium sp. TaxID=1872627 RepID=UPI00286A28D5|nr:rhomboid family intramembrane serine protease [Archangium sp.]
MTNEEPATPPPQTNEATTTEPDPDASLREFGLLLARTTPRVFVTRFILAINILIFGVMVATGVAVLDPSIEDLLKWGADFGPSTISEGQLWRLLSSAFIHVGVLHLAVNMWSLWAIGRMCERIYGNLTYTLIYLLSAVGGALASNAWNPMAVSAGASGALFGIDGALIAFLYLQPGSIPPEALQKLRKELLWIIGFNLMVGFSMSFVNNAAHLGGLVTGAAAGALVTRDLRAEVVATPRLARLLGVLVLLAGATALVKLRVDSVPEVAGDLYYRQAYAAMQAGDNARAVELATRVIEQMPEYAPAHFMRGLAHSQQGQKAEAYDDYTRALGIQPDEPDARLYRCLLGNESPYMEISLADCERSILADPARASSAHLGKATILMAKGELAAAKAEASRAVELAPEEVQPLVSRAWYAVELGEWEAAEADYARALKLQPQNARVLAARGQARRHLGRLDEALADLDAALALAPELVDFYSARGLIHVDRGDVDRALVDFDEALRRTPEDASLHNNRAWALVVAGRSQEALASADRAVELNPRNPYALGTRCWARADVGDMAGALEDCRATLALDAEQLLNAGMLQWLLGKPAEALVTWERALKEAPYERRALEPWMERARQATAR